MDLVRNRRILQNDRKMPVSFSEFIAGYGYVLKRTTENGNQTA